MLDVSRSDLDWLARSEHLGCLTLGWTGRGAPNIRSADRLLVALDGCLYNRDEFGPVDSDAELLLILYRRYGLEEALRRLNGDFAAAVFDARHGTLWLARDRFGVKPLYYVASSKYVAFASRLRALMCLPGAAHEVNRQYVGLYAGCHYRYFDNDPEATPYAGIAQLPAATALCLRDGEIRRVTYWTLEQMPEFQEPERDLAERYRDLLVDAVSLRRKRAERPGFTLSGGMDSSSVLACAVQTAGCAQDAFSTVYVDRTYDESADIRPMREAAVSRWHAITVDTPDLQETLTRMIAAHDEPVATATWLSHFLLCEEAVKQGVQTLFGGLGGDELNAGEYEYFPYHFADLRILGEEEALAHEVRMWIRHHDHPLYRKSAELAENNLRTLVDLSIPGKCLPCRERLQRYASALRPEYFNVELFTPKMDHPFPSYLKNRGYQDIFRETLPCCLRAEDRQSSAFGLLHVVPFLDHRLVEFMFRVPGRLKIRDGVTKRLLREAMYGILPEETRMRIKKTGWNAPAHRWFCGKGQDLLLDMVHSRPFRDRGIYDLEEVERLIREHERIVVSGEPRENHMMFLWQMLNLEIWLSGLTFAEGRGTSGLGYTGSRPPEPASTK